MNYIFNVMRSYMLMGEIMKIYLQNGLAISTDSIGNQFYVQSSPYSGVAEYTYPGDSIKYDLDDELVTLYDTLRDLFFPDTAQYYSELGLLPIYIYEAGMNSDCAMTKTHFAEFINNPPLDRHPNFFRHLYLADCQFLIGSIQNLLGGMNDAFVNYFIRISEIGDNIIPTKPDSTMMALSPSVTGVSSLLESYFTKAHSILDMFCKLAFEIESPSTDFSKYSKLKSANKIWGLRKDVSINGLKETVFEQCPLIEIIEALRNEVVHNGSWELNPRLFVVFKDAEIVERFMLFPDIEQGHLATVKNRRHFFSENNKVNDILPKMHIEFMSRVLNTAKHINGKTTVPLEKDKLAAMT